MKTLIIYDGTQRIMNSLSYSSSDFDLELLDCDFATTIESALTLIQSKNFQQIIIAGQSVDKREVKEDFTPYNILVDLANLDLQKTKILLMSPNWDFLNKGEYLAKGKGVEVQRHFLREKTGI